MPGSCAKIENLCARREVSARMTVRSISPIYCAYGRGRNRGRFRIESENFYKEYRISGFVEDLRQVNAVNMGGNSVFFSANDYEDLAMLAQKFPAEFCESFFECG